MAREWKCICKDCGAEFFYSDTTYQRGAARGFSRPERCAACRKRHAKEVNSVGQPFFKIKPLTKDLDHSEIQSSLGRLFHERRKHTVAEPENPQSPPDPGTFGITDEQLLQMCQKFEEDPGLRVMVVVGPTGSGKSTHLPYRLLEPVEGVRDRLMFHRYGQIVVTQPRIQATETIPRFIAKDMLVSRVGAGFDVGIRNSKNPASDWSSKLVFCTDGTLINWISSGHLDKINTIMIDEAHERSLIIDVIIGLLSRLLPRYPRLRVIIASATIDSKLFVEHFDKCLPERWSEPAERAQISVDSDGRARLMILGAGPWEGGELTFERLLPRDAQASDTPTIRRSFGASTDFSVRKDIVGLEPGRYRVNGVATVDGRQQSILLRHRPPNCKLMKFGGKSFTVSPHFRRKGERELPYRKGPGEEPAYYAEPKEIHKDVAGKVIEILKAMYTLDPDGGYITDHTGARIDITERRGDILAFLQGKDAIEDCCKMIRQEIAKPESGLPAVEVLPLYSKLPTDDQKRAVQNVGRSSARVVAAIVELIRSIAAGTEKRRDILAIFDQAGQIDEMCESVRKAVSDELPAFADEVKVVPLYTSTTARQIFPRQPDRHRLQENVPPADDNSLRVVIATSRASAELSPEDFSLHPTQKQESDVRRVVVSTNVAETSLTIEGILHVVDSGLINQDVWDCPTGTGALRPVLQSRAGCKQRWGRAGRLQPGDAWTLYTREQFGDLEDIGTAPLVAQEQPTETEPGRAPTDAIFEAYSRPAIRRSSLEKVVLQTKAAGIEDLNTFPWIVSPKPEEVERSLQSLLRQGALDGDGDLTERGVELWRLGEDSSIGALLITSDRFACAEEMATVLAVNRAGLGHLLRWNSAWDDATQARVAAIHAGLLGTCTDDLELALKIHTLWVQARESGRIVAEPASGADRRERWNQLRPRWTALVSTPAWSTRLSTAAEAAILGVALERVFRQGATSGNQLQEIGSYLSPSLDADRRREAEETLRQAAGEDKQERPKRIEALIEGCRDFLRPVAEWPEARLYDGITTLGAPGDVRRLLSEFRDEESGSIIAEVAGRLGELAGDVWCRLHFIDKTKLEEGAEYRETFIKALTPHKKQDEYRPPAWGRLDRVRRVIAYCLPDQCYTRCPNPGEEERDCRYALLAAQASAPPAGLDTDTSSPSSVPDITIDRHSACADPIRRPESFVCLNRKTGGGGSETRLYCSFIVALPTDWCSEILDDTAHGPALPMVLLRRMASDQRQEETLETLVEDRVFLDQRYPIGSTCRVVIGDVTELGVKCEVHSPHRAAATVSEVLRYEEEEISALGVSEEGVELSDLNVLLDDSAQQAVADPTEDTDPAEEARDWEGIFSAEPIAEPPVGSGGSSEVVSPNDDESSPHVVIVGAGDAEERSAPASNTVGGIITGHTTPADSLVEAEVTGHCLGGDGTEAPLVRLAYPSTEESFHSFVEQYGADGLGREVLVSILGLEEGVFGRGGGLRVKETVTGLEVTMGPRDLSFGWCPLVPRCVFNVLGRGGQFSAWVEEFDADSRSVRLTTHRQAELLLYGADSVGAVGDVALAAETSGAAHREPTVRASGTVLEVGPRGATVALTTAPFGGQSATPEELGVVLAARVQVKEAGSLQIGQQLSVAVSCRGKVEEKWEQGWGTPQGLSHDKKKGKLVLNGPASYDDLRQWRAGENEPRVRCALYRLYERSNELSGTDEGTARVYERILPGTLISARVLQVLENGVMLETCGSDDTPERLHCFLPRSHQLRLGKVDRATPYATGALVEVVVIEGNRPALDQLVVSHKEAVKEATLASLQGGQIRKGVVRRITDYGAFVDLGGVDGLLHITEMAWTRVDHPSELLKVDDEIDVVVLRFDRESERISLGRRQLLADPWEHAGEQFKVGQVVTATVSRLVPFGAFVKLETGIEGLIPNAELASSRGVKAEDTLTVGQQLRAMVMNVRPGERRMTLSLRQFEQAKERQQLKEYMQRQEDSSRVTIGDLFGSVLSEGPAEGESANAEPVGTNAAAGDGDGVHDSGQREEDNSHVTIGEPFGLETPGADPDSPGYGESLDDEDTDYGEEDRSGSWQTGDRFLDDVLAGCASDVDRYYVVMVMNNLKHWEEVRPGLIARGLSPPRLPPHEEYNKGPREFEEWIRTTYGPCGCGPSGPPLADETTEAEQSGPTVDAVDRERVRDTTQHEDDDRRVTIGDLFGSVLAETQATRQQERTKAAGPAESQGSGQPRTGDDTLAGEPSSREETREPRLASDNDATALTDDRGPRPASRGMKDLLQERRESRDSMDTQGGASATLQSQRSAGRVRAASTQDSTTRKSGSPRARIASGPALSGRSSDDRWLLLGIVVLLTAVIAAAIGLIALRDRPQAGVGASTSQDVVPSTAPRLPTTTSKPSPSRARPRTATAVRTQAEPRAVAGSSDTAPPPPPAPLLGRLGFVKPRAGWEVWVYVYGENGNRPKRAPCEFTGLPLGVYRVTYMEVSDSARREHRWWQVELTASRPSVTYRLD